MLCSFSPEADLRIGEVRWGDSGIYYCKVVITDDLEGLNEGHVELLVLGESSYIENRNPFRRTSLWIKVVPRINIVSSYSSHYSRYDIMSKSVKGFV